MTLAQTHDMHARRVGHRRTAAFQAWSSMRAKVPCDIRLIEHQRSLQPATLRSGKTLEDCKAAQQLCLLPQPLPI